MDSIVFSYQCWDEIINNFCGVQSLDDRLRNHTECCSIVFHVYNIMMNNDIHIEQFFFSVYNVMLYPYGSRLRYFMRMRMTCDQNRTKLGIVSLYLIVVVFLVTMFSLLFGILFMV
jgi:hypothetical protein